MARAATIGNGSILVGLDDRGQVRDFYHPYVGHANHVSGGSGSYWHRIGVWVDGAFSWLEEAEWEVSVRVNPERCNTDITARHGRLGVTLSIKDVVHNEKNIFLRSVLIKNDTDQVRTIKIFFAQQFRISESRRGDTGYFDPRANSIIHYKGHDVFLIHAEIRGKSFSDYSIGIFDIEGKDGTFRDAEDGELERNPIEHGSVDSVLGLTFVAQGGQEARAHYWIAVGKDIPSTHAVHDYVLTETPERIFLSVENYWRVWLKKEQRDFSMLSTAVQELYAKSLYIIRAHADNGGGIIASGDSEMLNQGRDNYSYVWPRDSVVAADALVRAGYRHAAERLFSFFANLLEPDGYLMHKYRVDGVLGSSWHPWVQNGVLELPIQEDETASVLFYLGRYFDTTHDVEFIESLYNKFIEPAAEFLCSYRDPETGLPHASYDLWEEKYGTSTYTTASVYGGLVAAAHLSELLGKAHNAQSYQKVAEDIRAGLLRYLYFEDFYEFPKSIRVDGVDGADLQYDHTIDSSSFFGLFHFGVLAPDDSRLAAFKETIDKQLWVGSLDDGGYVRYAGDRYYTAADTGSPNPWIICTMWMAQYYVKTARSKDDLKHAEKLLEWAVSCASESGILAEQVHPHTKKPLSTAPLVWSHAEFVITVDELQKKWQELAGK